MKRLTEWAVELCPSRPYMAPELHDHVHLSGRIVGTKKRIVTARIVESEGRRCTTKTGSVYELGRIATEYREFIDKHRLNYDATNPVKLRPSAGKGTEGAVAGKAQNPNHGPR